MDISSVFGKPFPQKVTLDCNIVTVTGELIPKGTGIFVHVCSHMVTCKSKRRHKEKHQKLYLNIESDTNFKDIHCEGKIYRTFEDLNDGNPRYFSCTDDVFAFDDDETVRVKSGQKLELQKNENNDSETSSRNSQLYTNVTPKSVHIVRCLLRSGKEVQIPPSCNTAFKAVKDPNTYKTENLLRRFGLPRQVEICDERLASFAEVVIGSNVIELLSKNITFFLLFNLDNVDSDQSQSSCVQTKENIKCCEFVDPSTIKLQRRLDHTQIGEIFDSAFCIEREERGKKTYTLLGTKETVPVSRLCSGRQDYIDMGRSSSVKTPKSSQTHETDSGFVDAKHKSNTFPTTNRGIAIFSSSDESDEYIDITLDTKTVSPIPDKLYSSDDESPTNEFSEEESPTKEATEVFSTPPNVKTNEEESNFIAESLDISEKAKTRERLSSKVDTISDKNERSVKTEVLYENRILSDDRKNVPKSEKDFSESEISNLSSSQLADLLRKCKLARLAEVCADELVDGDLFLGLTEEILKEEPFNLNKFEMLKVNKMKGGWKPNL